MQRCVEPEWLDELPVADTGARGSRRDLRRVNWWMGHERLIRQSLLACFSAAAPRRILDLGAGDGTFMLQLARSLALRWPGVELVLVDRQPLVKDQTRAALAAIGWKLETVEADVLDWIPGAPPAEVVIANLFLHHFQTASLSALLTRVAARAGALIACEPRRSRFALIGCGMLRLIGCNAITRHDAVISVRAGFRGQELSMLWPAEDWQVQERPAGFFSHLFCAQRTDFNSSPCQPH